MGEAESPEPQIRRGIGDATEAVFYGVDRFAHKHIAQTDLQKMCTALAKDYNLSFVWCHLSGSIGNV